MTLLAFAIAALHLAAPWLSDFETKRYASDIAYAAADREEVSMLVATGTVESSWQSKVERCETVGPRAEVTLWQLRNLSPERQAAVCASNRLATRLARGRLAQLRRVTGDPEAALVRYVGAIPTTDPRARKRIDLFRRIEALDSES